MKIGLVLEGGAMRGMFTAGILDVMMENKISVDGIVGVSAGAVFGCNYKSGQIGRTIRYNMKYCRDKRYVSFRSLIFTGDLYGTDFCYRRIPQELDIFDVESFRKSPVEFYVTSTDMKTGKPVYHKCELGDGEDLEWMRASASMPLASRIVKIHGLELTDGGVSDSVPLKFFEKLGYEKNIVILTQPKDYVKTKNKMIPLVKLRYIKYPELIKALETRHEMYNSTSEYIKKREKDGDILVIRPECNLPIGHVEKDPEKLLAVYNIGRKTAEDMLDKIKEFTKKQ